jgi:ABC-type transport system involved in multi-copper enzyme maturation permease subunit
MFKVLLAHEVLSLLKSRRVFWTVLMFLLLFASIFVVRVIDYQKQLNQYIADVQDVELLSTPLLNYSFVMPNAIQQPPIFSIYNRGFQFGRTIIVRYYEPIVKSTSLNETQNITYNKNNQLDITFLITFFLSIFILLISYDSINGEKQVGTLRIILTYPIKRQSFILKKILGVFIFVALTFTTPYLLSLLSLIIIYANFLTINFFLSAFFYWFLVMLFIFFFTLLGVFISTLTALPSRSLVYSLVVWLLLTVILPVSWDYIVAPSLFKEKINLLTRNSEDKLAQAKNIFENPPEEANFRSYSVWFFTRSGDFYRCAYWGTNDAYEVFYRFQKYAYDKYFPASRETEQANDTVLLKYLQIERIENIVFFFNPVVLFNSMSLKLTGNSQLDYLKFLQDTRSVRDGLVDLGIREGWLLDYRYFNIYKIEDNVGWEKDYDGDRAKIRAKVRELEATIENDWIETPDFRGYAQPVLTFGEIFERIWQYMALLVLSIVVLWLMIWQRFKIYDIR